MRAFAANVSNMSAPPKTVLDVSPEEAAAIRAAVLAARAAPFGQTARPLVTLEDAPALADFFADPDLNRWIYDLPRPPTVENTRAWIAVRLARGERGEALLSAQRDVAGRIDFQIGIGDNPPGFTRMGERDCVREDGTIRPSLYWEMTREQWRARTAAAS